MAVICTCSPRGSDGGPDRDCPIHGELRTREQNPNPILNMGVEIHREWTEDFWKLAEVLGLGHKETVNWIVDNWFKTTRIGAETNGR